MVAWVLALAPNSQRNPMPTPTALPGTGPPSSGASTWEAAAAGLLFDPSRAWEGPDLLPHPIAITGMAGVQRVARPAPSPGALFNVPTSPSWWTSRTLDRYNGIPRQIR